ncbi:hypothetical protein HQ560_06250 [bacterium]|nr:hypothetical protein [bacterium]
MIRLVGFFAIVAVAVGAALTLNSESVETLRVGYQLAQLEAEHRQRVEENHNLKVEVSRLRTTTHLRERMEAFGLDVVSPEEHFVNEAASKEEAEANRKSEAKRRAR